MRSRSFSLNLEAEAHKEDLILNAVFDFNANPKEGIKSLCKVYQVPETPEKIAEILHNQRGLLSDKVASFLSKNLYIMYEYFNTFNLKKPFVEALRHAFSGNLGLQGEAEFIDQELSAFSKVYCLQNPDTFTNEENAYMLAFATTLLLSDLHNPQLKNHMTIHQFISNIRGVISESTLSDSFLSEVYKQVKAKPFSNEKTDDMMALCDPRLKGFLHKRNDKWSSTWTKRFFVLANSCLYYFHDDKPENKDRPLGMIQLVAVEAFPDPRNVKRFFIMSKDKNEIMYVKFHEKGPDLMRGVKKMTFEASTEQARDKWLYRITKSLIVSLFTDNVTNDKPINAETVGISSDEHHIEIFNNREKIEEVDKLSSPTASFNRKDQARMNASAPKLQTTTTLPKKRGSDGSNVKKNLCPLLINSKPLPTQNSTKELVQTNNTEDNTNKKASSQNDDQIINEKQNITHNINSQNSENQNDINDSNDMQNEFDDQNNMIIKQNIHLNESNLDTQDNNKIVDQQNNNQENNENNLEKQESNEIGSHQETTANNSEVQENTENNLENQKNSEIVDYQENIEHNYKTQENNEIIHNPENLGNNEIDLQDEYPNFLNQNTKENDDEIKTIEQNEILLLKSHDSTPENQNEINESAENGNENMRIENHTQNIHEEEGSEHDIFESQEIVDENNIEPGKNKRGIITIEGQFVKEDQMDNSIEEKVHEIDDNENPNEKIIEEYSIDNEIDNSFTERINENEDKVEKEYKNQNEGSLEENEFKMNNKENSQNYIKDEQRGNDEIDNSTAEKKAIETQQQSQNNEVFDSISNEVPPNEVIEIH